MKPDDLETVVADGATATPRPAGLPTLPYAPEAGSDRNAATAPGATYGRFIVLGSLGSGGMGVVLSAYNPQLDRKVALKLLRPEIMRGSDEAGRVRLRREAQAMAKLSHPNVVTVYEAGAAGDHEYIAMELVAGETLRDWQRSGRRGWREALAMYLGAGRGLEAAHAAGLVHRDFKPENVLIGADGRPRVGDFGLVASGVPIDRDGAVIGTPAYMAPEQWEGETVGPACDQFAFCVALWEAVFGERPYRGDSAATLRSAVVDGDAEPQAPENTTIKVPGWLASTLRRGLARDPAARWPSMTVLLAELARRAAPRRRPVLIAALAFAVVGGGVTAAVLAGARDAPETCPLPTAKLDAIWSAPQRASLQQHLTTIDPVQGQSRFAAASAILDRGARQWGEMHVDACRLNRTGEQSDTLLDRRMDCLNQWLGELRATVDVVGSAADRPQLDRALEAVSRMSPLAACADGDGLLAALPPPARPDDRAEADAISSLVREIDVAWRAGRLDGLAERIEAVVARARALDHTPTLADALLSQVGILGEVNDEDRAAALNVELIQVAARAHDDRIVAQAWMRLFAYESSHRMNREAALAMVPAVEAAVARAGDQPQLAVYMRIILGSGFHRAGIDVERALGYLAEARALLLDLGAEEPGSPLALQLADATSETGFALVQAGQLEAGLTSLADARAIITRVLGADHTKLAALAALEAHAYTALGQDDKVLAATQEAARITEARAPGSPIHAHYLSSVAGTLGRLGRPDEGLPIAERALAMAKAALGPDDQQIGRAYITTADLLSRLARPEEALARYDAAIAILEKTVGASHELAGALSNRMSLVPCDEGVVTGRRAVKILLELEGETSFRLLVPIFGLADCLYEAGRGVEAIPDLEQAMKVVTPGFGQEQQSWMRFQLGRILVESRRDVARGRQLVATARTELEPLDGDWDEALGIIDAWSRAHRH